MTSTPTASAREGRTTGGKTGGAPIERKRVQITVTAAQHRLLRQAALTSGKSMSAFIAENASAAAYALLADNPEFLLDDPDWEHFLGLLGQPSSEMDALRGLLEHPGALPAKS